MSAPISDLSAVPTAPSAQGKEMARGESPRALPLVASASSALAVGVPESSELQHAVEALNLHFADVHTDLKFTVDRKLGLIVVTVVDARDGRVLRQIPSEEVLRIARALAGRRIPGLIEAAA